MIILYPRPGTYWLYGDCPSHGLFLVVGGADAARIERECAAPGPDMGPYCPSCAARCPVVLRNLRAEVRAGGETEALIDDGDGVRWVPLAAVGLGLPAVGNGE